MEYQLVDLVSGRPLGWYDQLDSALRAVVDEVELNGIESADTLALGWGSMSEAGGVVAEGRALAKQALERFPRMRQRSA